MPTMSHALATADTIPASPAPATATAWDLDPGHSAAEFKVRHLMISHVRGKLGPVQGTVWIDERDLRRSRLEVTIDARAIDTREPKRDEHLRSADFLDVDHHPTVTFRSRKVEPRGRGDDGLVVEGDLTIRGVTRPVTLTVDALTGPLVDPWGNTKRGASARARINRRDFGLTWNAVLEAGGVAVADQVDIEIEVELTKRAG
jgi:polyisoprenoid-binding protein YceI